MTDLYAEALSTFASLFEEARAAPAEIEANAMTVATATAQGRPSARTVLLKSFDPRGFVFYTHLHSHKGRELAANPQAALLFLWRSLREAGVQVRIEGAVEIVSDQEADAYFASRARMSQIGAWASAQSEPLASPEEFEQRLREVESEFAGIEVPRPPGWSGYRVKPDAFEFWYGAGFRLHERWRYQLQEGQWSKHRLYP
ncbi:pyridoxamine 5'-phosphate oxidase [Pseudoxanthomonas dokdonensis]|uniref:Pyridoxine/pyridoxamine 5'-phosphate oxidase n=1 Tax=Pseudoxanthomonas dokdonensis TaxID=344882 RepID=A0A0R0CUZ4_9GAMM|nr:pyridoxamine 5'-phosphate oxidase [Pseudoxanthomonas dokdonensis]KRG70170.1 pyridoxine/pyridoxamine 5'-phosphate oxidase [Pseudoxanthomonas dokdonensis]